MSRGPQGPPPLWLVVLVVVGLVLLAAYIALFHSPHHLLVHNGVGSSAHRAPVRWRRVWDG